MDGIAEKFEVYDLFVVIIPGFISTLCILYLYPDTYTYLYELFCEDKIILYAFLIGLSYASGVLLHEIGSAVEKKIIYKNGEPHEIFLYKDAKIVSNEKERILFENMIDGILGNLEQGKHSDKNAFTQEEMRMVFNYCRTELEANGNNVRADKMQSLYGMSRTMMVLFSILMFYYFFRTCLPCLYGEFLNQLYGKDIVQTSGFEFSMAINIIVMSMIIYFMYKRMKRFANYKVRDVLRGYKVLKDNSFGSLE